MPKDDRINIRNAPKLRQQLDDLVASGYASYTQVIEQAVSRLHQQEISTMNAKTQPTEQPVYYIDEQMLGDTATEQDARKMVKLLAKRGYNVEYGHALGQDETTIDDADWTACLDRI